MSHSEPASVALSPKLVEEIFPFLLAMDSELRIIRFGRALAKVCHNLALGALLTDVFAIARPRVLGGINKESLRRAARNTFFLDSLTTQIRMRGQMIIDDDAGQVLFLGSPWFTDIADLEKSGLVLRDFTIQDPIIDFLYMVQARTVALEDARRLGQEAVRRRDELEVINKQLDQANRAKNQFLANTSHELRTPLNGIIGMGTLLARQPLQASSKHYCDTILKSARVLLAVVNDILDISKIEAGKMSLESTPFHLHRMIDELTDSHAVTAHSKGIELLCLIDANVPQTLRGDPGRLRQILENLLSNAIKFTSQGEVALRVHLAESGAGTARLQFRISDTGIGIPQQEQPRLFQAFTQLDDSMSRRYGGTGLGLALSKQLATLMGGEIGVESAPGKGSTFWFTVNLEQIEDAPPEAYNRRQLEHVHVLVVDDNATNREFLSTLLVQWGAHVETAADALEAMQRLRQANINASPFDLALVDQHMPGMTGLDLVSVVAANQAFRELQLIVLSSVDNENVSSHPQAQRIQAVLTKPVRPSYLLDCLSKMFRPFAEVTAAPAEKSGPSSQLSQPNIAASASAHADPCDILVVDDNPINVEVAVRMLETLGHRADSAHHGSEALAAMERRPYALVFMDLQMPILDGYQATASIRQREGAERHTPVVAMTAHAMAADRQRALEGGFDDYIAKPLDLDVLTQIVRRWRAPQAAAPDAAATTSEPAAAPPRSASSSLSRPELAASSPELPPAIESRVLDGLRRFRRPNEPDLIEQITRKYLQGLPESLQIFKESHRIGDLPALSRCAHKLKSSSALIGALRLAELCGELETQAAAGQDAASQDAAVQRLVPQLLGECARVEQALKKLLPGA